MWCFYSVRCPSKTHMSFSLNEARHVDDWNALSSLICWYIILCVCVCCMEIVQKKNQCEDYRHVDIVDIPIESSLWGILSGRETLLFIFFRLRPVIANFWHVQHAQNNACETDMNIESLEWWPMAIKYNTNVFVSIGYHFFSSSSSSQYINTKSIPFSNLKRRLFERMHCVRLAARQINIEYLRTASIPSLSAGNCNDSSNMTQFVHERDIRLRRKAVG